MKKQKLGVAEKKFREREQKKIREIEQSGAQLKRDLEQAIDCLFVGIGLGMQGDKRR